MMFDSDRRKSVNELLGDLAETLDVSPSKYEEAKVHYDAVGSWLGAAESPLSQYDPIIYPQGSFALGTAVRPLGDDDFDVDAVVCLSTLHYTDTNQRHLKALVGDRLKDPQSRYRLMLDPPDGGRRCWTIKYADGSRFHLDTLPAVLDDTDWLIAMGVPESYAKHAIRITDRLARDTLEWPRSNPQGYVTWFKDRMRHSLEAGRRRVAMIKEATIEEIKDYEVRTALQRLIQLLKRHRDVRYNGDKDKPSSIIISTLAALSYDNQADLLEALLNVVPRMRGEIESRAGVMWVPNPVNPRENFADRWLTEPRKQTLFFEWLEAVEQEHEVLLTKAGFEKIGDYLAEAYGPESHTAMVKYAARHSNSRSDAAPVIIVRRRETASEPKPTVRVTKSDAPWGK